MTTHQSPTAATLVPPSLPTSLPDPIALDLYSPDARCPRPQGYGWWGIRFPDRIANRIGWAKEDPPGIDHIQRRRLRQELLERTGTLCDYEMVDMEAPRLQQLPLRLSTDSEALLQQLIDHRRRMSAAPQTIFVKSPPVSGCADPGYTMIHVATGITASFYLNHNGKGGVLAKAYSNPHKPPQFPNGNPTRFQGYGVGRRLYLAAHALWPTVRWQDTSARDTTRSLRHHLHQIDPYTWQDKHCPHGCSAEWWSTTRARMQELHPQDQAPHDS